MVPNPDIPQVLDRLKKAEEERDRFLHDLTERVKELQCLYKLGLIIDRYDELDDIFKEFVEHIPQAWQYPEVTCARIIFQDQEFSTKNFSETEWNLTAPLIAGGAAVGVLQVCYLKVNANAGRNPFLKEEHALIDHIAERFGRVIERKWAQEALRVTNEEREELEHLAKRQLDAIPFETPNMHLKSLEAIDIVPLMHQGKVEREGILHDLTERIKELQCLYSIEILFEKDEDLAAILEEFVRQLPDAWQYPELTCARIQVNEQEYCTPNFRKTEWTQTAPLIVGGDTIGTIEIYYLEEMPDEDEGPFLQEERSLINSIAGRLSLFLERSLAQEALEVTYEEREELEQIINQGPGVVFLWRNAPGWPVEYVTSNAPQLGFNPKDFYSGQVCLKDFVHPDDWIRIVSAVDQNTWKSAKVLVQQYRIIPPDGIIRWVEERRWIRENPGGEVTHYQGILLAIPERK